MMQFCEIFKSIQGEGFFAGAPSVFVRTSGCNLRCCFAGGSICDTSYTSYEPEIPMHSEEDVINFLNENNHISHLVVTGGEPLLHKDDLKKFIDRIRTLDRYITITIETNGTIDPSGIDVDLWSVSPKLSTSVPSKPCIVKLESGEKFNYSQSWIDSANNKRINIDILAKFIDLHNLIQYKFVYSGKESLKEIEEIVEKTAIAANWDIESFKEYVILMPEGQTNEQLQSRREEVINVCMEKGWHYTDRLQILVWEQKRCV